MLLYWIKTSDDFNSFKYESSDLCCDYSMPIRGIPLTPHQSTRIIIISSHEMTACQHHSNVVLQSHDTSLIRYNTTCLLGLFSCLTRIVCFISLIDGYIITCRVLLFLYCWRVRSFRFFCLAVKFNCCWVTWFELDGLDSCCGVGEDSLDLDSAILLFILFFIALILSLKLFIIACRALIVTNILAV